jgi:hypothetical protein
MITSVRLRAACTEPGSGKSSGTSGRSRGKCEKSWPPKRPDSRLRPISGDEVLDVDHAEFARTCAIDIPCPEPDRLGRLAHSWGVFIMAQVKARHEDWPDRFFNVGSIIDPDGGLS